MESTFARSPAVTVLLLAVALVWISPFAWLVITAFDPQANGQLGGAHGVGLDNFLAAVSGSSGQQFINSMIISIGTATLTVLIATAAAYPLSRIDIPGKNVLLWSLVLLRMMPEVGVIVPVFFAAKTVQGLNAQGMIVSMTVLNIPFALLLLKNFFDSVPIELEESAYIEGASLWQIVWYVVVPLSRSGLAVVWFFTFTGAWNAFLLPLIFARTDTAFPMSVGLYAAFGQYGSIQYGFLAAYSIVYAFPAVVVYFLLRRNLNTGFAGVGVKG
ncbi:MAG: carbohydrate ABC transporter permease [Devosia nanyangense]|uniref:Carbohydrate ABC transporter permease n=1 Tax=Devosia nanyangense TaxID=1228055 RepID=A0A933L5C3_9HYPH|nr:carbohydrate ABC transporter permease [Devosia nanyangense]